MATINGNDFLNFFSSRDRDGDIYDGGARADILVGGPGNDQFFVDHIDDRVIENPNEGDYDGIIARVSYSLFSAPNVEQLVLQNGIPTALGAVGNELDNVIYGNNYNNSLAGNDGDDTLNGLTGNDDLEGGSGDDSLDGAAGDDRMSGNVGNDIYFVNSVGDEVIEYANNGIDTVRTWLNYTLGEHLENLTLLDKESLDGPDIILHVNATGNDLDNTITGNIWNNVLDGKAGNDTLIGGLGDDTYIVNDLSETIIEAADGGLDTVIASISYTLGANIENLTLTGDANISGTGNALNNTLRGNAYNTLSTAKKVMIR
jgi:Ca2+-binding RTX toxin-like protein